MKPKPDDTEEVQLRLQETEDHVGAFVMFCRRNGFSDLEAQAESFYVSLNHTRNTHNFGK